MKNAAKLTYLFGILGFLVSCGANNAPAGNNPTNEESSQNENKENETPKENEQENQNPNPDEDVTTEYVWDVHTDNAYLNTLGRVIPKLDCFAYEYELGEDDYGDPTVNTYCYFSTEEEANEALVNYAWTLYEEDRYKCEIQENYRIYVSTYEYIETTILFANKNISKKKAIELQCLVSYKNNQPCIGIFAFTYIPQTPNEWPVYAVNELLTETNDLIPYEAEGAQYSFMFYIDQYGYKVLEIQITDATNSYLSEEIYFNKLLDAGYVCVGCNDYDDNLIYYHRPGGTFEDVTYYDTYPDFEDSIYYESLTDDAYVIFDYNLSSNMLILDIYNAHEIGSGAEE